MADEFENHCWKDIVPPDVLDIYTHYARKTFVGPSPALLAIDLYELAYQGGAKPVEIVAAIYDLTEEEKVSISSRVRRLGLYLETPALAETPGTTDAAAFASMQ